MSQRAWVGGGTVLGCEAAMGGSSRVGVGGAEAVESKSTGDRRLLLDSKAHRERLPEPEGLGADLINQENPWNVIAQSLRVVDG